MPRAPVGANGHRRGVIRILTQITVFVLFAESLSIAAPGAAVTSSTLPADIKKWELRLAACNDWMSEESLGGETEVARDHTRRKRDALKRLKCDDVLKDEKRLREKYRASPPVIEYLDHVLRGESVSTS